MKLLATAALLLVCALSLAQAADRKEFLTLDPAQVTFGDGPEESVKVATLYGDPDRPGLFIQWMKLPPGTRTPPHWHSTDEIFTVLSGSIGLGLGGRYDESAGKEIKAGGFAVIPARAHHFGWSKDGAVIQVQGTGPFSMNWLDTGSR